MKHWILIVVLSAFVCCNTFAFTNVPGGHIVAPTVWNLAGSPYIIQGNVYVDPTYTLTINAGVQVKFDGLFTLIVNGNLSAVGAAGNTVVFTTNNVSPAAGQWSQLQFNSGTNSTLTYCDVYYGGYSQSTEIALNGGYVQIANCRLANSQYYGINIIGGSADISNTLISSCQWPLYRNSWNGTVTFGAGNNFTGNVHNGVYMLDLPATVAGDDTIYNPGVPYYTNSITIPLARSLTILPGVTLKMYQNTFINVNGTLIAVGGSSDPSKIYFTDYRDDVWGGDTNGDGIATGPAVNWWYGIYFLAGSSTSSRLDNCKVRYTGGSLGGCVNIANCGPKVKRCDFSISYYGIRIEGVTSAAEVDSNTFAIATYTPVAMNFESFPSFQDNVFSTSNNGYNAIGILPSTLTASAILPQRNFTTVPNVTYVMLGSVTVPAGMSLTISPGVVIKWLQGDYQLDVLGTLIANGNSSPTGSITFTSVKDDNWGNPADTQNNGSQTVPATGDWGCIKFEDTSVDANCVMNYCKFYYGSYNPFGTRRAELEISFASPQITHCDFANTTRAITLYGNSNPTLQFNNYHNTTWEPVELSVAANPTFGSETMSNVGYRALGILPETVPGNGEIRPKSFAGFTNITYILAGTLTIPVGAIVTVDSTIVIKGSNSSGASCIDINGALDLHGTVSSSVVVTSIKDDTYGNPGDTNGDGSSTTPARGDYGNGTNGAIIFEPTTDDVNSHITYTTVKWANYGVTYNSAAPTMSNCLLSDNQYGLKVIGSSNPLITNTTINNSLYTPVLMSMASDPTFTNISFSGNGYTGLGIYEGTLTGIGHLKRRDIAGITSIAYVSLQTVTIASNGDLTIDPGVVIKLTAYYVYWQIDGKIRAIGKAQPDSSITFTSISDDSRGGDTNNDGNSTNPTYANWYEMYLTDTSVDSVCRFSYCNFNYGSYSGAYQAMELANCSPTIDHCQFNFDYHGILITGSSAPALSNNTFSNIYYSPVWMDLMSSPSFSNDQMFNVGLAALGLRTQTITTNAIWPRRNFCGYNNITYVLEGSLGISSGASLTVPSGIVVKATNQGINVDGTFVVQGVDTSHVVFTSTKDDGYGNPMDTNQDGTTTLPGITDWTGITYNDVSNDGASVVNYANINYSNNGLAWNNAAAPSNNCTFFRNSHGVSIRGSSNPTLTNFTFNRNNSPIYLSVASNPTFVGGTMTNNDYLALEIISETTSADYTIPRRTVAGDTNIVYLLRGDLTIGSNSILTINPGVMLKFRSCGIYVNKGMLAVSNTAGADSQIVFTSYKDDFYGGDTNHDLDTTVGARNDWSGISFNDVSVDPLCHLKNCVVRFAGNSLTTTNASPTIEYSLIADALNGLIANGASNPIINYCDLIRFQTNAVNNVGQSFNIDARFNWWGSNTGPTVASNPGGTGTVVNTNVNYANFQIDNSHNPRMGDVSLNSTITAYDAALILLWIVNPIANPLNALQQQVADVTENGTVSALDASYILQFVAGIIDVFPAEINKEGTSNPPVLPRPSIRPRLRVGNPIAGSDSTINVPMTIVASGDALSGFAELVLPAGYEFVSFSANTGITTAAAMYKGKLRLVFAGLHPIDQTTPFAHLILRPTANLISDAPIVCTTFTLNEDVIAGTDAVELSAAMLPRELSLMQNYPNPFNPSTTVPFVLPRAGNVNLAIFDVTGRKVADLVNGDFSSGTHSVVWSGKNESGNEVAAGTYFVKLRYNSTEQVRRIQLVR